MKKETLKNGTRVVFAPIEGTEATTVLVLTKVGSRNESLNLWGASHFIEHMMFKGTKKRKQSIDISRELDRFGAGYNAYTGKDITGYYVKIDSNHLETAVDLLSDMIFHSVYDNTEMEQEKKVIIEEIKMYEENPIMHVEDLLESTMFDGSALGREIAGTPESMIAMKRDEVIAYRDAHYIPSEMVVVVAGKIPRGTNALIEEKFGARKAKDTPERPEACCIRTPGGVGRQEKSLKQIQLAFGFPTIGRGHEDVPALKLLSYILGGAMSSRLFIEVRERRGLCYMVRSSADMYDDVGTFVVRAGLDAKRLKEASKTILEELEKMKDGGVKGRELEHAKDHISGAMKLRLEDSSNLAEFYGRQELFLNDIRSPQEWLKEYQNVSAEDVERVAREVLISEKMSVAAIGPYKTHEALRESIGMLG